MTSQSPRIYTYKITFEEVPYYYYGVKKEKYFNQEYWGSPTTHKWVWDFYTPKKQILEIFHYTDEGWLEAQEVEKRLIKPVYTTDKWCLNENCGGVISLKVNRETGKKVGKRNYELGLGIHALTTEERSEIGKKIYMQGKGIASLSTEERKKIGNKIGRMSYELGLGIHSQTKGEKSEAGKKGYANGLAKLTAEQKIEKSRKAGKKGYTNGLGKMTKEERRKLGKKSSEKINAQKWMCLETGYVSTAAGVVAYQRARGIDTSKRKRVV